MKSSRARSRVLWRERLLDAAAWVLPASFQNSLPQQWSAGCTVLLYHRVVPDSSAGGDPFSLPYAEFVRQLTWVKEHRELIPVTELCERLRTGRSLAGTAAVTFDDGYSCTYQRAWPFLMRLSIPSTVFLDTARINTVADALTSYQIREMAATGVEFGSHSVSHQDLLEVKPAELRVELHRSRAVIEQITGLPVRGFAYPFGHYNSFVREAVREAGHSYAFTCRQDINNQPGADLFALPRVEINWGDDLRRFQKKINGAYSHVYAAWYAFTRSHVASAPAGGWA